MFLFSTKVTKKMDLDEVLARSQVQQHPNVYDGVNTFDITVPPDVDEDRFLKALEKDLRDYFASYPWDKNNAEYVQECERQCEHHCECTDECGHHCEYQHEHHCEY